MNDTLMYLVKVNIAIVLFYLFYRLFFAGDTFWKTRRFYLLLSILVSFVYPFLSIETWMQKPEPVQQMFVSAAMLPEFTVSSGTPQTSFITLENVLLSVYALVVLVLLVRMWLQLFSIVRMSFQGRKQLVGDTTVIALEHEVTPFSFFGSVFINPALHTGEETRQILAHELTHVRQWHSLDVLAGELLTIAFWFNPATWLLKREMRQNLEFLADNKVIESGFDSKTYQYHLLQLAYQAPKLNLTNKFNVSPLKKRITMMNLQKSKKARLLKYSLVFPLALALVVTSNAQEVVNKAKKMVNQRTEKISPLKLDSTEMFTKEELEAARKSGKSMNQATGITNSIDSKVQAYFKAEKMPQYPGGEKALMSYLDSHLSFPVEASNVSDHGRVVVRFIVNETGKIQHVRVLTSQLGTEKVYHKSIEKKSMGSKELQMIENEAIKAIENMPNWIPGQVKGKNVAVVSALPINFNKILKSSVRFYAPVVKSDADPQSQDKKTLDNQPVYQKVDKMPQYPGGDLALINYISRNVKYPAEAAENGVQGTILVRFIVNSSGKIEQAEIAKGDVSKVIAPARKKAENAQLEEQLKSKTSSQYALLEQEALRVVNSMPDWIPGEKDGKKVAVSYALPIKFKLGDGEEKETLDLYSPTGKNPLYVVDDKVVTKEVAEKIKRKDVESIALLKDAAAIKLYGEKGKDGVLLIKMKK